MANIRFAGALLTALLISAPAAAQKADVVGFSGRLSSSAATLDLFYAQGPSHRITFRGGEITMGGSVIGQYTPGGALETAWRELLGRDDLTTAQLLAGIEALGALELPEADAAALTALRAAPTVPAAPEGVEVPPMPELAGLANLESRIAEAHAARDAARNAGRAIRDEIRNNARQGIQIEVPSIQVNAGPPLGSVPGGLLALFGTLLALSGLALGTSFFAERQLDVIADTVQRSPARSFFVGLFAQPLLLPALGAVVVGLILTVVGILIIPFAVAGFFALLAVGLVGGFLAVSRATGATFLARRNQAVVGGMGMVKSVVVGLALLLALWLPAVLLGWVPVMGTILRIAAALLTWGLVTTGFGAAILTRGGVRGTFGQRYAPPPVPFSRPLTIPEDDEVESFSTSEWLAGKKKS